MGSEYALRFIRKEQLTKDTWLFVFKKPEGFVFSPGQYQTIFLPLPNGRSDSRDMTIASPPFLEELWVVTKIPSNPSPFKKVLLALGKNDTVRVQGPGGGFVLKEDDKIPRVFLAGGIGITPFYSMMKSAFHKNIAVPLTLLVSFSSKEDIIFLKELEHIAKQHPQLTVVYTLSGGADASWKGERGRISEELIRKYVSSRENAIFMIAGSTAMVDATNDLLLAMGVTSNKIKIDYFTGYEEGV